MRPSGIWIWLAVISFAVVNGVSAQDKGEKKEPEKKEIKKDPDKDKEVKIPAKPAVNVLRQGFPAGKADPKDLTKSDTAWEIEWDITSPDNGFGKKYSTPSSVLAIRSAKFMFKDSAGKVRWFTVLKNLEVGEILVPYDRMEPVFLDVSEHGFRLIPAKKEYLGPACVTPGEILDSDDPRMKNKVMKEVHDDGMRWLNSGNNGRRGEKMLVWSIFDGGNYRYILEYGFSDDGLMSVRIGATAHNYFSKQKDGRDVHLHVGCWRWDPELREEGETPVGGAKDNQIQLVRRMQRTPAPNGMFKVDITPFNPNEEGKATEGFADWNPEQFTVLRVQSTTRKNSSKDPQFTAYDLIPQRAGAVRNYPWKYAFANHDFWVTQKRSDQKLFREVPLYAGRSRPLEKNPVTIWHNSPNIHVPRGEDYGADGTSSYQGSAITSWTGFLLRPINLFDSTPLYPQKNSQPSKKIEPK
jgi:primary-amine oxidase